METLHAGARRQGVRGVCFSLSLETCVLFKKAVLSTGVGEKASCCWPAEPGSSVSPKHYVRRQVPKTAIGSSLGSHAWSWRSGFGLVTR